MAATYPFFCMGNPLLDMQITNGEEVVKKYGLKANDAILAEEKHLPIYDDISKNYGVSYVAGGAAQNAARGAAYILPPNSVVYTGSVGDDELAEKLRAANDREGVHSAYYVRKGAKTGVCAAIITNHDRSLVTTLRASEMYDVEYLSSPHMRALIDGAKVFYSTGFFLTHGTAIALELAKQVASANKIFALNVSAPFVAQFFNSQLSQVFEYCDLIFGNETEAEAWATTTGQPDAKDIPAIAKALASLPKVNTQRPRVVIITQGAQPTILVSSDDPSNARSFPIIPLRDDEIVDTNGAGDAFAGGFLGALVAGKSIDDAVGIGHKLASMCVKQMGPQYQWPKVAVM